MKIMNVYFVVILLYSSLQATAPFLDLSRAGSIHDIPCSCAETILHAAESGEEHMHRDGLYEKILPVENKNDCYVITFLARLAQELHSSSTDGHQWAISCEPGTLQSSIKVLLPDKPTNPATTPDFTKKDQAQHIRLAQTYADELARYKLDLFWSKHPEKCADFAFARNEEEAHRDPLPSPLRCRAWGSYDRHPGISLFYQSPDLSFDAKTLRQIFTATINMIKANWHEEPAAWDYAFIVPYPEPSEEIPRAIYKEIIGPKGRRGIIKLPTNPLTYNSKTHCLLVQKNPCLSTPLMCSTIVCLISALSRKFFPYEDIKCTNTWFTGLIAPRFVQGPTYVLVPKHLLHRFLAVFKFSLTDNTDDDTDPLNSSFGSCSTAATGHTHDEDPSHKH